MGGAKPEQSIRPALPQQRHSLILGNSCLFREYNSLFELNNSLFCFAGNLAVTHSNPCPIPLLKRRI